MISRWDANNCLSTVANLVAIDERRESLPGVCLNWWMVLTILSWLWSLLVEGRWGDRSKREGGRGERRGGGEERLLWGCCLNGMDGESLQSGFLLALFNLGRGELICVKNWLVSNHGYGIKPRPSISTGRGQSAVEKVRERSLKQWVRRNLPCCVVTGASAFKRHGPRCSR